MGRARSPRRRGGTFGSDVRALAPRVTPASASWASATAARALGRPAGRGPGCARRVGSPPGAGVASPSRLGSTRRGRRGRRRRVDPARVRGCRPSADTRTTPRGLRPTPFPVGGTAVASGGGTHSSCTALERRMPAPRRRCLGNARQPRHRCRSPRAACTTGLAAPRRHTEAPRSASRRTPSPC